MKCRFCNHELTNEFIDLFNSPPSNSYLTEEELGHPEVFYPLKLYVCDKCFLVQVDEYKKSDDIFNEDYAYFSSISQSWLKHSKEYVEMISERLNLDTSSHVMEIASNDGYLLQYFVERGIPCVGVEPTASTADVAISKGIPVIKEFFSEKRAETLDKADLILGNNVLAHVPDINDFVAGLKVALKPGGTVTMEFPHLLNLINYNQFDTIYHEHFSYLSLYSVQQIFAAHGLNIYDVEEIPTHGGSLRVYACHKDDDKKTGSHVAKVLSDEKRCNLDNLSGYESLPQNAMKIKTDFLNFLLKAKAENKKVAAYGAAAKGNTLLNYCGVKSDLIEYVVDRAPSKQNKFLPGSHIPVVKEDMISETKPDYLIIFPWNIQEEVKAQLNYIKDWGCKLIAAIPEVKEVG